MRAVNLVPADQRRSGSAGGTQSYGVHIVLGLLAVVLVMVTAVVLTNNQVSDRQAKAARLSAEATAAQAQASALKPYRDFAAMKEARIATVQTLAASRFNWQRVIHQFAQALPHDANVTELKGAVSGDPTSASDPTLDITGCTTTQAAVARVMTRLRLMDGVTKVTLSAADRQDTGGTGSGSSSSSGASQGCGRNTTFTMSVHFKPSSAATATSPAQPAATPQAQAQTASAQQNTASTTATAGGKP